MHASEKTNSHLTIEYLGSCTEQLRMYIHHLQGEQTCCAKLQSRKVTAATIFEGKYLRQHEEKIQSLYDLKADPTADCSPGYLRVIPTVPRMWQPSSLVISPDGKTCLSSRVDNGCHRIRELAGLRCPHWPAVALEWVSRHRLSNWPGEQATQSAVEEGCLVITRAHPFSSFPDAEWQYVFPCAERLLALDALTVDMRYCFWVFKSIVDYYLIKAPARLKTTHLKTVLYFACETIPIDLWKENKAGCLLYLLHMLLRYLTSKRLPNYFIIGNNMLDGFTDEQLAFFTTTIQVIRFFPIHAIAFMLDHYGFKCLDTIHFLIDDIEVSRRDLDINKTVQGVFVPVLLQSFTIDIICQFYEVAANMLHGAHFFIEIANSILSSKDRTVITFHDFVVQTLKAERQEDIKLVSIHLDRLFGTQFQEFYKFEVTVEALPDTRTRSVYPKDAKNTLLQDNGSSKPIEEPFSKRASETSGNVLPEAVTSDREKHRFREPQHQLKDLLGADKAGKFADKLLPSGTMDSIVLQSEFLLKFVSELHNTNQLEECQHFATCAIDLIKQNQADQLDVSSIEDPVLRGEVEKHHLDIETSLKSYLKEFVCMSSASGT